MSAPEPPLPSPQRQQQLQSEQCPVCRTDSFLNPRLRLLVSPCYHKLCTGCIARLYAHGSARCPLCPAVLRASSFAEPLFGDLRVEKECRVRRQVMLSLGERRRDDFVSGRAWEDYLEEVEGIVERLLEDVDADSIQSQLDEIRRANSNSHSGNNNKGHVIGIGGAAAAPLVNAGAVARLKIEEELEREKKRRRTERREQVESIAVGRSLSETLLKGLKSSSRPSDPSGPLPAAFDPLEGLDAAERALLPFMYKAQTVLAVSPEAEAGGLAASVLLDMLWSTVNRQLNRV